MRNVNQYRNLLSSKSRNIGLKPRYILNQNNEIQKIPKPSLTLEEYNLLKTNPQAILKHEYFLPGKNGPILKKWPFTLNLLKCFTHYATKAKLSRSAFHKDFCEIDHPSNAVNVTLSIMKEFLFKSAKNGQKGIIILFPQIQDFDQYVVSNTWIYRSLEALLKHHNLPYINLGDELIKAGILNDYKNYFAPHGHYNAKGNRLVAQIMQKHLKPILGTLSIQDANSKLTKD